VENGRQASRREARAGGLSETRVLKHFQERMPYGLFSRTPDTRAETFHMCICCSRYLL
jgi:hypothetical protein